jgi:hypothetical protein
VDLIERNNSTDIALLYKRLRSFGSVVKIVDLKYIREMGDPREAPIVQVVPNPNDTNPTAMLDYGSYPDGSGKLVPLEKGWCSDVIDYVNSVDDPALIVPCLVLWGGPGRGKTMLLELLSKQDNSGRHMHMFSCGSIEAEDWATAVQQLSDLVELSSAKKLVLCIDDFDALQPSERNKMAALLAKWTCRRILVTNNYYAPENRMLKDAKPKKREKGKPAPPAKPFLPVQALGVHKETLVKYLCSHFPALADNMVRAWELVEIAAGDARAALLSAQMDIGDVERDYASTRAIHLGLHECVQAPNPREECATRFGGRSDIESLSEVLRANAPRMVRADAPGVLDALVDAYECNSVAAMYDSATRESGYAGADGIATDKSIAFELGVSCPASWLSGVVDRNKLPRERQLVMEFPARWVHGDAVEWGQQYKRVAHRVESVSRFGFESMAIQRGAQESLGRLMRHYDTRNDAAIRCDDYCAIIFGPLHDNPPALLPLLAQKGETSALMKELVKRCAEYGLECDDFLFLCHHELRDEDADDIPADGTITAHFGRSQPNVARAKFAEAKWAKPKAAPKKRAVSGVDALKEPPQKKVIAPMAQKKISSMFAARGAAGEKKS